MLYHTHTHTHTQAKSTHTLFFTFLYPLPLSTPHLPFAGGTGILLGLQPSWVNVNKELELQQLSSSVFNIFKPQTKRKTNFL